MLPKKQKQDSSILSSLYNTVEKLLESDQKQIISQSEFVCQSCLD